MIEILEVPSWSPEDLYTLLDEHGLISGALKRNPLLLNGLAEGGAFYAWIRNDEPMAILIEFPSSEPEVLDVVLVPLDRELGKTYRMEVAKMSATLRERWFMSYRRVQALVPASRVNMQRCMRALGFQEETRHGIGMRGMIQLGGSPPEAMLVYGLLEGDPFKVYGSDTDKAKIADETENV